MASSPVVPAHLSYLAIYNPSLGATDETVRDQIVFYYSQRLEAARRSEEIAGRSVQRRDASPHNKQVKEDGHGHDEDDENERLRQVGLAQGMVDFVKNFSDGVPLETLETEKSRTVLKEVEPGWWILAAINLTQLPATTRSISTAVIPAKRGKSSGEPEATYNVEYSSREVSPAPLLLAQLEQAHKCFLLHHATSLSELWKKHESNRSLFCNLLSRYWTRFIWTWDLLLHGNPAAEMYGGVKLAGGGELGVGVGEEEWGSGEREVLEDFAGRTEGLVDIVVGRYGDAPVTRTGEVASRSKHKSLHWLGNEHDPRAEDGVIFSGMGGVSRSSLVAISHWMQDIFMYGDAAYGVGENPSATPRHRKKRRKVDADTENNESSRSVETTTATVDSRPKAPKKHGSGLRRQAMKNRATGPGIPPPLVTAVEASLKKATTEVDEHHSGKPDAGVVSKGKTEKEAEQGSLFGTDKVMKYLSLGYGTSWTLNPKGFQGSEVTGDSASDNIEFDNDDAQKTAKVPEPRMQELDPTPEVSDEDEAPFVQRLEESNGRFMIGLSGDLENTEFEDESEHETINDDGAVAVSATPSEVPQRIFLRTLVVEMSRIRSSKRAAGDDHTGQIGKEGSEKVSGAGKTSAAASIDGADQATTHERVQVAVYVHQPFIFVFLFQRRTPALTMPSFYRAIHHTLGPLQKSLLRSTDIERLRERMKDTLLSSMPNAGPGTPSDTDGLGAVYDLIYDPIKLTIRTSVPNIPLPGSLAAEGLHRSSQTPRAITVSGSWYTLGIPVGSSTSENIQGPSNSTTLIKSDWTRIEALNVHTHILNTWTATRNRQAGLPRAQPKHDEVERTIKTSRNWWIVWMKLPTPSTNESCISPVHAREAFLVRRSPGEHDAKSRDVSQSKFESRIVSSTGKWLLREQPKSREVSSSASIMSGKSGSGGKGVSVGADIDARRWVEALARLSL